jgi:hypothetical protein
MTAEGNVDQPPGTVFEAGALQADNAASTDAAQIQEAAFRAIITAYSSRALAFRLWRRAGTELPVVGAAA